MTNLPQGWVECRLGDVLKYEQPTKYIVSSANYDDSYQTPVLTAGKSFIIGYTNELEGICKDLPVVIFDDFTTSSQFVDFPFKVKSSAMKILRSNGNANIKFLYYYMQTIQHNADTHKRYWISEYSQKEIKLPSLDEQKRIVEKIEEEFAKIDEGIEKLKLAQEQIVQYKQAVLKYVFSDENYHFKKCEIRDVFKVVTGKTPSKKQPEFFGGDIPFVKPGDLNKNIYLYETFDDTLTEEGFAKAQFLPKESVLVSCIGNLGKKAILGVNGSCNQQINAILPNKKVISKYIYYYIDRIISWMENESSATTVTILNKNTFEQAPFLHIEKAEQIKIVNEIEKRFEVADKAEKVITNNLEKAQQLKQSILKKAFEGRLVPQDSNDEPASVLLEKIKIERTK